MTRVLLIEDDGRIRDIIERGLGSRGFDVTSAPDGPSGLEIMRTADVDVVLLDLILPGKHGLEVLQEIREQHSAVPVIALTALGDLESKIGGLDAGADDYVTKPFSVEELAARVRARLRRHADEQVVLRAGPLSVDLSRHLASLRGRQVVLSGREVALLASFLRHQGEVLSREQLLKLVWDLEFDPGSNVVEVYVAALRRKIGPEFIETIRGSGYRFVVPQDVGASSGGDV